MELTTTHLVAAVTALLAALLAVQLTKRQTDWHLCGSSIYLYMSQLKEKIIFLQTEVVVFFLSDNV